MSLSLVLLQIVIFVGMGLGTSAQAQVLVPGEVKYFEGRNADDQPLDVIEINGTIAYPMADLFEAELLKTRQGRSLLVRLNSPGGSNEQGNKIIQMMQAKRQSGTVLDTAVENGSVCASMCVPLFLQGRKRYGGEGSLFMFHGATRPSFSNIPHPLVTEDVIQTMLRAGINPNWILKRRQEGVFSLPGSYWISGKELFDQNADVITKLIPRHVVEEPWTAPFDPNLRPR